MRLAVLAQLALIPALIAVQEPHVHGGHAACYEPADWLTQERAYLAGDVQRWNAIMRPYISEGRCWLTEDGGTYELAESEVPGTLRIRGRPNPAVKASERWSVVSIRAVGEP